MRTWPWMITLRRLTGADVHHLANLSDESFWISKTWGGPAGLAASGYAWGAFAGDQPHPNDTPRRPSLLVGAWPILLSRWDAGQMLGIEELIGDAQALIE